MKKVLYTSIAFNFLFILLFVGKRYYYSHSYNNVPKKIRWPDQWDMMRNSAFDSLSIDTCDIVFIGTSLTEAFPLSEIFNNNHIKNRGIGCNETSHILHRCKDILKHEPNKLFIEGGINDFNIGVSVDSVLKNYNMMLSDAKRLSPSTKIFIQSILPTCCAYDKLNDSILLANDRLKNIAYVNDVSYIDIYSKLVKNKKLNQAYTGDGIHLNGAGYVIWAKTIRSFVQ